MVTGRPRGTGIKDKDYDLIYFDPTDLSWEAEDAAIRRMAATTADDRIASTEAATPAAPALWVGGLRRA